MIVFITYNMIMVWKERLKYVV